MANLTCVLLSFQSKWNCWSLWPPWFYFITCTYGYYGTNRIDLLFCLFCLFFKREDQPPLEANNISAVSASELNNPIDDTTKTEEMGGLRNRLMCRFVSSTCFQMNRRKTLGEDLMETPLRRCLSTLDITMLGNYTFSSYSKDVHILC
jgi:hypothetical protein